MMLVDAMKTMAFRSYKLVMGLQQILIDVEAETAAAYEVAPDERRRLAISLFAQMIAPRNKEEAWQRLNEVRCRISKQVEASGMTEDDLAQALAEEE